jgi:hypothetical protein
MPKAAKKSKYSPHPMLAREKEFEAKLEAATGKSLAHWIGVAKKTGEKKQMALMSRLSNEHPLTRHQAMWVASYASSGQDPLSYDDPETYVDGLYSGDRAKLRPLHEKIVDAALAAGGEAIVTSCKTMVPVYRKHVFAQMRPLEDGVELSLALGDVPAKGRLEKARHVMPGDRLAHRVVVRSEKEIDAELHGWLSTAYELGAGKIARAASAKTPPDLAKALKASAKATATWESCTDAMRRDWILWIESAKQAETRDRRRERAIESLAAGKKKYY